MHPEGGKVKFELPLPRAGCTTPPARVIRWLLLVVATILSTATHAVDLGTIGPTYGIAEPHLLEFIQQRLEGAHAPGPILTRLFDCVVHPWPVIHRHVRRHNNISIANITHYVGRVGNLRAGYHPALQPARAVLDSRPRRRYSAS